MTAAGVAAGEELIVVTSRRDLTVDDIPIKNFRPIGEFELPEYELQRLSFPPILQILDYVQREQFTEIIISTPGPDWPDGLAGREDAEPANERNLSHRYPGVCPHPDRGPFSRKPGLELHALALRAGRHGFRELGAIPEMLDRPRVCAGEAQDPPSRPRYRSVQSGSGAIHPSGSASARMAATFACFMSAASRAKKISMCWRPPITKFARRACR